jgi:hypothetical protein
MADLDRFRGVGASSLVGGRRDFVAGLEVVVVGRGDMGDSGVCDGEGDGRAWLVELTEAMDYGVCVAVG